jgi:hypothetical protein
MAFTTLLHLYVRDFNADPNQTVELLRSHLVSVRSEIDEHALVYLLTPIIANLVAVGGHLESLNKQCRISENEEQCKAHLHATKSCADILRSIATWTNLIFGRAIFIVELIVKVAPPGNELAQLVVAIKQASNSRFFLFVMKSLTTSLVVIVDTAISNAFAKALMKEGSLEKSFRSCLGALRQCIAFVSACSSVQPEVSGINSSTEWQAAAEIYLSFIVSIDRCSMLLNEFISVLYLTYECAFTSQQNLCRRSSTRMDLLRIKSCARANREECSAFLLRFAH